jgi:menaquinone-9 beta-reductase
MSPLALHGGEIRVVGAGPAGSAAAIAALSEVATVRISERARSARHKVCGEFISPEAFPVLQSLGVWEDFIRLGPARIHRCVLHFGSRAKQWTLPEPAYGLSRLELDRLLLERAARAGATICRGEVFQASEMPTGAALILATGRRSGPAHGSRLFGFKAHFEGPTDDAVELFLGRSSYIGVNTVEQNLTNVCGIATEDVLRSYGFRIDDFIFGAGPVAERLRPLSRCMPWLTVGPLTFSRLKCAGGENLYPAGDALGFVDPFTGSGILNALLTGRMAGTCAGRQVSSETYMKASGALLNRPFAVSAIFRALLRWEYVSHLASLIPGNWIYRMTRPVLRPL